VAPILADTDVTTATIVAVGTLSAPPEVVWRAFAERELIERWYGPADAPARFESHVLEPGARSLYAIGGDEGGEPQQCFLQIMEVEPHRRLVFTDGHRISGPLGHEFLHATVELEASGTGSRMFVTQHFADRADMEQIMLTQLEDVVSGLS